MIAYGENIQVFCGNSNPQFAQTICKELGVPMGKAIVTHFADGEASVTLEETVRGADVFLIQSTCKPVNDSLMELLIMVDACRRANVEYLRRAGDMAGKYGLRIAVENMLSNRRMDGSVYWRYCTHAEELVDLVDAIDMENVQICLDVGHAHYMGENLYNTIKLYGKRLIALHIHDNNRMDDLHLLPFHGTLKWDDVLLGLRAVDYAGDFTFEIQNATRRAPEELYPQLCRTAFEIGQYLLRRYNALA